MSLRRARNIYAGSGTQIPFPLNLNPGLYFDMRNMEEFEDTAYANTLNFQQIAHVHNQVTGNDAVANPDIPIIQRQSVFGYSGVNCLVGGLTVNNYAAFDYQYNESFYVAFAATVIRQEDKTIFNKRDSITAKGGWYVYMVSGKLRFGFSDVTNGDSVEVEMNTSIADNSPHDIAIQNTDGSAAGISFYLDSVLQGKTVILNNAGDLSDIKGGSLKIGTAYSTSHDGAPVYISNILIGAGTFNSFSQYQTLVRRSQYWWTKKYISNPVISGTTQEINQAYPSGGFYWADTNKYYRYVGSTSTKIVCESSDDGYVWAEEGVVISAAGGTWADGYTTLPCVRVVGSTIYLFIMGAFASADGNIYYCSGWYSSTSPTTGFVQNATPTMTAAIYNSVFNNNMTGAATTDVVKVGSIHYHFGFAVDVCRSEIFVGTSSTLTGLITPIEKVCAYTEADFKRSLLSSPQVSKTAWGWMMLFTVGLQGATRNERNIRCAISTSATPTNWTVLNEDYLNPTAGTWDEKRVYVNSPYKKFDDDSFQDLVQIGGKYVDYFSGHDLSLNAGVIGINEFSSIPDLRTGRLPSVPTFATNGLESLPNCISRIFSDEHCYYTANGLVYQVLSSVNYKETTPIGADDERPLIVQNQLNGYPVIRFEGNKLKYGMSLGNPSSFTISFLIKPTDLSYNNLFFGSATPSGGGNNNAIILSNAGEVKSYIFDDLGSATITATNSGVLTQDDWNVFSISYTNGETFFRLYKNGINITGNVVDNSATNNGTIIRSISLGSLGFFPSNGFTGDLAYFAIYNSALSAGNILTEYNVLATKYNL